MTENMSAQQFVKELEGHSFPEELKKYQRYFKLGEGQYGEGDEFMGVRMGQVFALAKEFVDMPPEQIERLLESPIHEVRAGALSIMDKQARRKKTPGSRRKELFDLYLRRTDRVNNWDLVDLALHTWSAATCSINRATFCTSWRAPETYGNAALQLSVPPISLERAM